MDISTLEYKLKDTQWMCHSYMYKAIVSLNGSDLSIGANKSPIVVTKRSDFCARQTET